jgi:uncharacterized membrane protein
MLPICLWRWYINITITVLDIIHRPVFSLKLNSTLLCLSAPHRKHITSPLRVQQVNAICRFVRWYIDITITILDIIHRPVFYLKLNSTLLCLSAPHRKHITSPLRAQQVNAICRFVRWYINITITILNIIHRPVFYLKLNSTLLCLSAPHRKHITSPLRVQQVNAICRFVRWYINITITILDIIHLVFKTRNVIQHRQNTVKSARTKYI